LHENVRRVSADRSESFTHGDVVEGLLDPPGGALHQLLVARNFANQFGYRSPSTTAGEHTLQRLKGIRSHLHGQVFCRKLNGAALGDQLAIKVLLANAFFLLIAPLNRTAIVRVSAHAQLSVS
jgi:hypothetical protein